MKRIWIWALAVATAALLVGCAKEPDYYEPDDNVAIIRAEDNTTPNTTETQPPPLTVSGKVRGAQVDGELIDVALQADSGQEVDIRINADTTAVGDIYALDDSCEITATVAEWQLDDKGYFGTALSVSVDNQSASE